MRNINNTVPLSVTKSDGTSATVTVRTLRIQSFPALLATMPASFPEQAEIYTGNKPGWSETVSDESIFEIVNAGESLNADFFAYWLQKVRAQGASLKAPAPSLTGSQGVPSAPA